jgi:hypothetical protein
LPEGDFDAPGVGILFAARKGFVHLRSEVKVTALADAGLPTPTAGFIAFRAIEGVEADCEAAAAKEIHEPVVKHSHTNGAVGLG